MMRFRFATPDIEHSARMAELEFREEPMDDYYRHPIAGFASRLRVRKLIAKAGDLRGKSVLDVGCEAGYVARQFEQRGAQVAAFDFCWDALISFHAQNQKLRQYPSGFCAIAQEIPIKSTSMDIVLCTEVLEHAPEAEKIFAEFHRILKPGGILLVTFPNEPLRRRIYPIIRLFGINTDVEKDVTLYSHSFDAIRSLCSRYLAPEEAFAFPWIFPMTHFIKAVKR